MFTLYDVQNWMTLHINSRDATPSYQIRISCTHQTAKEMREDYPHLAALENLIDMYM